MPYTAKGKCVYRKDTGKKVGCTKGSVKKYLAALHANVKDVNESEDEFEWVNDIKLSLGFDDLKIGDVVRLKDYDNNNWEVVDIYMSDPRMTGKPSEKRIKFKVPFRNSRLELWKSPLNSENYFELIDRNPDRVYFNVNESEDEFEWAKDSIEGFEKRPTIVYYHEIQDLLEGTEFSISMVESRTGDGIIFRLHHLENGVNLTIDAWSEKFFKPNVIEEDLLSQINHFEDDIGDSYSTENYRNLYSFLRPFFEKYNNINESEEWYDEVLNKKPLLRFDDIMVGDILSNTSPGWLKSPESKFDTTYFHVLGFEDGVTWRNAYQEPEKYIICSLVKEDSDTGNYYSISRTDMKFPRGTNQPFWTLVYREGVVESINESEEFDWVEIPELPENNDFISSVKYALKGSLYDLHLYTTGQLVNRDYHLVNLVELRKGNQTLFRKGLEYFTPENVKKEFDDVFTNIKNQEKMLGPGGMSHNPERFPDLFSKMGKVHKLYFDAYELLKDLLPKNGINESEDEFDWVQDLTKYLKVGQEFSVTRQLGGEPFKAKIIRLKTKPNPLYTVFYFVPSSMAKPNTKLFGTPMTAQKLLELMELGYWTPVEGNINESEDEFEWAQDIVKNSFLEFNGKEVFIDIRGGDSGPLNGEELKKLYDIVKPYINKGNRFINHEGEEILWMDNRKCFEDIVAQGRTGKFLSISLHCGIEDNDFLPLKGAICCLKNTYEEEANTNKEYIIPVNAREIIGGAINESEWFEDVVKDPIMLKVEELEMGDIVIPTRFNQQEYVVTGKGTSVKMLHAPTHWVTLKRNTKENTGGVYIEHDSEIGKACRFELILPGFNREENLNESEDDSELFWAEDLLKGIQESVDITDKLDIMEELPIGSILQVRGYQDEMELDMHEVKLIDKAENQNFQSTYYLFKLKEETWSDGSEMTHCGNTPSHRKICECREGTDDDLNQTEVGKCWWIELKEQDKVIYYPNRVDLTENKIKKPLLTEGRYDAITRKVVRDIMKTVTEGNSDSYNLPWDISHEQEYEQEGLSFSLELDIIRTDTVNTFEVRTAIAEDEENIIMMSILMGPNFSPQKLQNLFYKLQEDIRHEIEHFTQIGPNRIEDRPTYKGSTANLKTIYGHHKNVIEIPALVHGFYRRAKLEKRPIDEIMMEDLDSEIERGLLSKNQAQKLLTIWLEYTKKNLPHAVYRKE